MEKERTWTNAFNKRWTALMLVVLLALCGAVGATLWASSAFGLFEGSLSVSVSAGSSVVVLGRFVISFAATFAPCARCCTPSTTTRSPALSPESISALLPKFRLETIGR